MGYNCRRPGAGGGVVLVPFQPLTSRATLTGLTTVQARRSARKSIALDRPSASMVVLSRPRTTTTWPSGIGSIEVTT